ncbi:glycosyl transferase family 41-domain-containing protein [Suillus americanus]|nr:glycosyl transferase family 41-domain-containing protein [Suillus americanus]
MLDPTTGTLPNVMLFPDQAQMLSAVVFASPHTTSDVWAALHSSQSTYEIKTATSSALLTLARRIQEGALIADLGLDIPHCSNDALVLLLHYLALSLFPSASAFNDTGVVLCGMSSNAAPNTLRVTSGRDVARLYYEKGLQIDPAHPHLLSNFGSLLKDAGHNTSAVGVFNHALKLHPELDIALVNMANTLKDMGRPADAVPYYLKAVNINPSLVDAYCGLSMSMNAVCNWTARDHWLTNAIAICEKHLSELHHQNIGILGERSVDDWLFTVALTTSRPQCDHSLRRWVHRFYLFSDVSDGRQPLLNEGSFLMRLIDWYRTRMQHRRYIETYGETLYGEEVPHSPPEAAPTARLFCLTSPDKFTLPLPGRTIRRIAHRNALRVSHNIMTQISPDRVPSLPLPPLKRRINIGYVSSDFSDHPLSHLMKSVFQLHDQNQFCVFLYATSPSDGSVFRQYFEQGDLNFLDVSSWSNVDIVNRIEEDHIHIRWCDYLVCDSITCPVDLFARVQAYRKRSLNHCCQHSDFGVSHTYFVTDHKQSYRHGENLSVENRAQTPAEKLWNDEIKCRTDLRRAMFPNLPSSCQNIFATWLRILARVPHSILWLLRFPPAGEAHLIQTAKEWAGDEIASRIKFTDVAAKDHHIYRCRVPDLFLDTVLWAGTPLIACAWPSHRHKMSSRVAASLASATGFGEYMVVSSREEYEERAVALGNSIRYTVRPNGDVEASGDLLDLRRCLFLNRDTMPLFDTERWTRNLEKAYRMAWRRWVDGSMFRMSDDGCIWVKDDIDIPIRV